MSPAVFGHGHLRLYLLYVLDDRPMHGYEIIQALSDRFGGTYVPSAGTIYPRLAKLEAEGLVTKQTDGRKTVYAITDAGRTELNDRRDELDGIESGIGDSVRRLADEVRASVSEAMGTLRAELAAAARETRDDRRAFTDDARNAARAAGAAASSAAQAATTMAGAAGAAVADVVHDATTAHSASMHSNPSESRSDARAQLQRAEVLLAEFRQDVRTELRTAAARGALASSTIDELESELSRLRADLQSRLP